MIKEKDVTRWERELFSYTEGRAGGFYRKLVDAFMHADGENTSLLLTAFPKELTPVHRYCNEEGYWEDLQERLKEN